MTFDNLNIHPDILKAVKEAGYTEPSEIQVKAIPQVVKGFDIRGSAQTGTGKTAAFLLPALNRIMTDKPLPGKGPRILILVPTRELAMQIEEQANKYSKYLPRVKSVCIVGGVPYPPQMRNLSQPYDILIATPGRLLDHMDRRTVNFGRLDMLVLDEADRMLDMGFIEPIEEIVAATPDTRQTLLFSATLEGSVVKLSKKLLKNPLEIVIHSKEKKNANIDQRLHYVDNIQHKNRLLDEILGQEDIEHTIVFTATKRHADELVGDLQDKDHKAAALHGDMNQRQRTKTITKMKAGKIKVLVATDVAARGIDVQSVSHVINFDLPNQAEDYVHRIGRTGRAGAKGTAHSFVGGRDIHLVKAIERFTGQSLEIEGTMPKSRSKGPGGGKSFGGKPGRGGFKGRSSGGFGGRSSGGRSDRSGGGFSGRSSGGRSDRSGGSFSGRSSGGRSDRSGGGRSDRSSGYAGKSEGGRSDRSSGYAGKSDGARSDRSGGYAGKSEGGRSDRSGGFSGRSSGARSERSSGYAGKSDGARSERSGGFSGRSSGARSDRSSGYAGKSDGGRSERSGGFAGKSSGARSDRSGGGFAGKSSGGPFAKSGGFAGRSNSSPGKPNSLTRKRKAPGSNQGKRG